jgi:HlyD family secretion protein
MKISNLDIMEVDVEVNESDIISVAMGNEAEIEADAYLGNTFKGHVTEIGNTALNASSNGFNLDQVTNFSVKIRIDSTSYSDLKDSGAPFRPGMSATVDIMTKYAMDVLCAPIQCITSRNDTLGVFILDGESAVWSPVEVGIQDNQMIEIRSGLNLDQTLVSGPYDMVARKLNDGDEVISINNESESKEKAKTEISVTIN